MTGIDRLTATSPMISRFASRSILGEPNFEFLIDAGDRGGVAREGEVVIVDVDLRLCGEIRCLVDLLAHCFETLPDQFGGNLPPGVEKLLNDPLGSRGEFGRFLREQSDTSRQGTTDREADRPEQGTGVGGDFLACVGEVAAEG